jgi:hypothetical protein
MAKGTADTSLVKQAHLKMVYTPDQIRELARCRNPITGPEYFLRNFFYIIHPKHGQIKFDPFDYQLDLINNYHNYRFSINMLGRQMGKTTVAAGYIVWKAMFQEASQILIAAHKAEGASEIMSRIRHCYECVPDHIRCGVSEWNKTSITFDNNSVIQCSTTNKTTGRGKSLSLIYIDEFAFVPENIAPEFWVSLSATLAEGGDCIITSTPNSDEDTFATIFRGAEDIYDEDGIENPRGIGKNGYKAYKAVWHQHPNRGPGTDQPDFETEQKAVMGAEKFDREHNCEFLIFEETLINSYKLVAMKGKDPMEIMGKVRWYKRPSPECIYTVSLDPAIGTKGDNAAIQVFELPSMRQVAEWAHNETIAEGQIRVMQGIMDYLYECGCRQIYWSVENNTVGEAALAVIRETGEENFHGEFLTESKKTRGGTVRKGFNTGNRTKLEACEQLKRLVEQDHLALYSGPLISELKTFVAIGNTFKAKPGTKDDMVMSLLLNIRMIHMVSQYEDEVYSAVNASISDAEHELDEEAPMPWGFL